MVQQAALQQGLFADSLLQTSWAQRSRRSWTTFTSFGLQALALGLLFLLPLLKTVGIPLARSVSTPISMGKPSPELGTRPRAGTHFITIANPDALRFVPPGESRAREAGDDSVPDPMGNGIGDIGIGPAAGSGFPNTLFANGTHPVIPAAPPKPVAPIFQTSSMLQGSLIRRVEPVYPPMARNARIQGSVVLFATIGAAGTIENLRVLSGHPLLVAAAVDAVKQWRYRPYILNHQPIEVQTQITVNFVLSQN